MKFVSNCALKVLGLSLVLLFITKPVLTEEEESFLNEELVEDDLDGQEEEEVSLDAEVEEESGEGEEDEDLLDDEGDDDDEEEDEVIMHKGRKKGT
jgi:hypothetical protein